VVAGSTSASSDTGMGEGGVGDGVDDGGTDGVDDRGTDGGAPTLSRVPRTRPVRVTVELSPMEHKALRQWCAQTSADLDLPVVAGAEVFRALLSLMRSDPEVADQVRAELERSGGSRRRH